MLKRNRFWYKLTVTVAGQACNNVMISMYCSLVLCLVNSVLRCRSGSLPFQGVKCIKMYIKTYCMFVYTIFFLMKNYVSRKYL